MNLLQINVTANWGSTGKIAEGIGQQAINSDMESWIAYGRGTPTSSSNLIRIGNDLDKYLHGLQTRLFDNHGLVSKQVTRSFIREIGKINPDVVHLHNIHGYYLNYQILFNWLKKIKKPVIWTLHDCWPWTGHCAYYTYHQCDKWKTECHNCPGLDSYPKSFYDGSRRNFNLKKKAFLGVDKLVLVPVSNWLANDIKESFLKDYPIQVIHNGINLETFRPLTDSNIISKLGLDGKKILLGVASVWEKRKGLEVFIELRKLLDPSYHIILVGLTEKQIKSLPSGMTGLTRTNNVYELVELYSSADVFVNPTLEDNFPTTNLEALASGTPVITYNTGGSPEAIDKNTGIIVPYKDVNQLKDSIVFTCENKPFSTDACRKRAEQNFNQNEVFSKYISLYKTLIAN
ncbi:MAG: glycosyltransferase [Bacteroides sp.]|nr:glycosyltransferase [Bacteroides sp.]